MQTRDPVKKFVDDVQRFARSVRGGDEEVLSRVGEWLDVHCRRVSNAAAVIK